MEQDKIWSNDRKYLDMMLYYEEENLKNEDSQKMQELDQPKCAA